MNADVSVGGKYTSVTTEHDLHIALYNWFSNALGHLRNRQPPVRSLRRLEWDSNGQLQVRIGGGVEPRIWLWIEQNRSPLTSLPETASVALAAQVASQTDYVNHSKQNINDANLQDSEYIFAQMLQPLLAEHLSSRGISIPNQAELNRMVRQITDFLRQPKTLLTPSTVVLEGVRAPHDFQLQDGVLFRATTLPEQRRYYFGEDPSLPDLDTPSEERGYAPTHVLSIVESLMEEAQEIAESFALACRLLDLNTVGYRYIEQRPDNPVRRGATVRVPPYVGRAWSGPQTDLTEQHIARLQQQWVSYRQINADPAVRILVNRFGWSFQRPSYEDQIIDLWIAIESIFAPEANTGELQYRMALRVSRLLYESPRERQEVFTRLKQAYNSRSRVVHGSPITKAKEWEAIIEQVQLLRSIVKIVLQKVIDGWRPQYPEMDFRDRLE